jgi:hypothetical protein
MDPTYPGCQPQWTPKRYLTSTYRPIEGGYQISSEGIVENGTYFASACTLGFNARLDNVPVFVTASHCSGRIAKIDHPDAAKRRNFFQANLVEDQFIGQEYRDPPFSISSFATARLPDGNVPCNTEEEGTGVYCRRSDMLLVRNTSGASQQFGYIARTVGDGAGGLNASGPTEINLSKPRMRITGEKGSPGKYDIVEKIGRTSGWTFGSQSDICLDFRARIPRDHPDYGKPIVFRCQHYVNAGADRGDSGAPVFMWGGDTVTLYGIVSARTDEGGFVYTSMDMIRLDLDLPVEDRTRLKTTP